MKSGREGDRNMRSSFETISTRVEQYLSGIDRALTSKEIAEGLGMTNSHAYTTLQLMEVFDTVQKVKRGSYYYFLKGVYDEEQISAMLPPKRVKPKPRRSPRRSRSPGNFLEEHLSTMRVRASGGEGPSALAMIGLTRQEVVEEKEEVLTEELPRVLEIDLVVEEEGVEAPEKIEPFATVEHLPKNARKLNLLQTKSLKEKLKGLDGYDRIERLTTAFAEFSALKNGSYGNVFYFSVGTNPWERVYRVTVDDSLSLEMEAPVKSLRRRGRSIYDPMINRFIECGHELVEIDVKGRRPSSVAFQLRRRIGERGLKITASSTGDFVYLESGSNIN